MPITKLCKIAAQDLPTSLLRCPKDHRYSPPPCIGAEKRKQVFIIWHVLPCRHVRFVISITCFVPQHFIPTPLFTHPLSVPHVRGDFISSATKYPPASDGWYFFARWSTVVLMYFTDFAIFRIRVYQDKKHPHIRYLSPFGVLTSFHHPLLFPRLPVVCFLFLRRVFPKKNNHDLPRHPVKVQVV